MIIRWNKELDIWEHIPYTPEQAAFWRERAHFDARCREASALANARRKVEAKACKKWEKIIANKNAENNNLRLQIAELQAELN